LTLIGDSALWISCTCIRSAAVPIDPSGAFNSRPLVRMVFRPVAMMSPTELRTCVPPIGLDVMPCSTMSGAPDVPVFWTVMLVGR
jgi:hypothetical protein